MFATDAGEEEAKKLDIWTESFLFLFLSVFSFCLRGLSSQRDGPDQTYGYDCIMPPTAIPERCLGYYGVIEE